MHWQPFRRGSLPAPASCTEHDVWGLHVQELPLAVGQLLGAECCALRLWVVSVRAESGAQLKALRRHLGGTVDFIQHASSQRNALSASF